MCALRFILLVTSAIVANPDEPTTEQVRETVQRSIPFIEEKGVWWIEEKECVTCHRVGNMVWSLTEARRSGFEVSDKLDEWRTWAIEQSLSENDKGKVIGLGNKEGVAQILLSLDADNADENEIRKSLNALLRKDQQPVGSWKPGGQLPAQKRPAEETANVSTMWLTMALLDDAANEQTAPLIKQAITYIEQGPTGTSTESFAVRLLLAVKRDDQRSRDRLVAELSEQQQSDGGWGWNVGETSDALGTGLALYALIQADVAHDAATIKRAQQFLISTQREDGSWAVNGTKKNKKDLIQETAVYWGTTWAAMGLIASVEAP